MFSKARCLLISLSAVFVSACTTITTHPPSPSPVDCEDCLEIGFTPYCCQHEYSTSSSEGANILASLNICVEPDGVMGVDCISGCHGVCAGTMLCCETSISSGLVVLGCVNII